ncbi:MAG: FtsX-like permease family protein [Vicinamibacteria bacterium]
MWTVVGIVISSPTSPVAYANRDVVAASVGEAGTANRAVVATRVSDRDRKQLLEAAFERGGLEVSSSQLVAEARAIMEDHLLMVANFLLVMALVSMMVGGLGLATTMSLAVLERTREIGVLRAIGAPHRTIRRIVIVEGLVIGILSSAIAVPLSLPMSVVVGNAFGRIMFQAPIVFVTAPSGLAIWMAVMLVLSTLASLYPAWIATRLTTSEALAYG